MPYTIGDALDAGWEMTLQCDRRRAGLKSARACTGVQTLHLPSLIATLGPDAELDKLNTLIRCPKCGSKYVLVRLVSRQVEGAAEKPRRRMRPAQIVGETLASTDEPWIVFCCDKCKRRGEYRKATLLKEFPGDTPMIGLDQLFAKARGCALARPYHPGIDQTRPIECGIKFDIDRKQ